WLCDEAEASGARFMSGDVDGLVRTPKGWEAHVHADRQGKTIRARILLLATGRTGAATRGFGQRLRFDRSCAVGGFAQHVASAIRGLLVEAVPSGWFYSSPTPN